MIDELSETGNSSFDWKEKMDWLENIEENLKIDEEAMIAALSELLKHRSERADAVRTKDGEVYPFGQGVQDAFECFLDMGQQMGFEVRNVDNYGGHIDYVGTGKPILDEEGNVTGYEKPLVVGIIGHLDVVPAGDGWKFEPYGGIVDDGMIYGRGTTDDKGPMVSCLYAMKAMKDAGYRPENTIRIIIGLDEETNWDGMNYYLSKVEKPDFGFTPDSDFPVINGEKGILVFRLARKFAPAHVKGLSLRSMSGGNAPNAVPDSCRVVITDTHLTAKASKKGKSGKSTKKAGGSAAASTALVALDSDGLSKNGKASGAAALDVGATPYDKVRSEAESFFEETGYKIKIRGIGKSLELTSTGIAAHGAKPEAGLNAISIMMAFLGRLNFVNEEQNDFIDFYNKHIGFGLDGEGLGMACTDEPSGSLILNVGMADLDEKAGELTINVRYPVTADSDEIYERLAEVLERYDIGIIKEKDQEPVFRDADDPMISLFMEIYQKHTGDIQSQPLVIGGGTYARACPGIVAFGAAFPGDVDLMHQKNEALSIARFEEMTKIYAETIYKLSQGDYNR